MDNLIFGSEVYWKICSEHTYKDDVDLNYKLFVGSKTLSKQEVAEVWVRYNLSDSIIYRVHCLIAIAEYWKAENNFKKISEILKIFSNFIDYGHIFYKDGFLTDCEQRMIHRIFNIFSTVNKFVIFELLEKNNFKIKTVISLTSLKFWENLDQSKRILLKDYFLNNFSGYTSFPESFTSIFEYFEVKQENYLLQALVDRSLFEILDSKNKLTIHQYQHNLENILYWIKYSSNKENLKNKVLIEIRNISKEVVESFQYTTSVYELKASQVEELLSQYTVFDGTVDILIDIAYKLISCHSYEENAKPIYLHESIASFSKYDSGALKVVTLGSEVRALNIRRANQKIESYGFLIHSIYMPFLIKRKDFDYTLHNLKVFNNEMDDLVNESIYAYLNNQNFLFISSILPLIEMKLRELLRDAGEADIQVNDKGGFDFRVIGAFFRSKFIEKYIDKSQLLVLSLILDERSGLNLRNKLAHGLMKPYEFNSYYSNLLILILVLLSCFDFKE